jgi:hypothetical protein
MVTAGRKLVEQHYSPEAEAKRLAELLGERQKA